MEIWVLIALIPPLLWAIGNVITKVIRTKHIKSSIGYGIIASCISSIALLGILFKPISFKFEAVYLIAILAGIVLTIQYLIYLKTVEFEDVSTLIPFFNFDPMMVLILSTIFLNEILVPQHYAAFSFLFAGGILISIKKKKLHLSKGIKLMLLCGFIYSISAVMIKYVSNFIDSWSVYMLAKIGSIISIILLILIKRNREKTAKGWQSLSKRARTVIVAMELIGALGLLALVYAIKLAPVSLVTVIGGVQSAFVLVIAALLSFKFPQILKEELNKKIIAQKSIAIILMMIGLYLMVV